LTVDAANNLTDACRQRRTTIQLVAHLVDRRDAHTAAARAKWTLGTFDLSRRSESEEPHRPLWRGMGMVWGCHLRRPAALATAGNSR
jgi:hypothetical protein